MKMDCYDYMCVFTRVCVSVSDDYYGPGPSFAADHRSCYPVYFYFSFSRIYVVVVVVFFSLGFLACLTM